MMDILGTRKGERVHTPVLRHDGLCHSALEIREGEVDDEVERQGCAGKRRL